MFILLLRFHIEQPTSLFVGATIYGGHADVYLPKGSNLFYYDVNSLYPYVMKDSPMPIGPAKWNGNLVHHELESLYGFMEAYVKCPESMKRPFLPYRDEKGLLIFPTGEFIGIYYSEELKYARSIGYSITPLRGYLYEKGFGLFAGFVGHMYENRSRAKAEGNTGLAYVYKILMNSLYGRFGINPNSTI